MLSLMNSANLECGVHTDNYLLPKELAMRKTRQTNSQYKVNLNVCTITSSFVSSTCHFPRAFKQLSTKFCTSLLSATTLFFTVFDFTLSTTSNGNSVAFGLLSGDSEKVGKDTLVFSHVLSSLRKILCLGVFSRHKPVKFDALKETVVLQETGEKGLLGLKSKLCPVSDNKEITQQDSW